MDGAFAGLRTEVITIRTIMRYDRANSDVKHVVIVGLVMGRGVLISACALALFGIVSLRINLSLITDLCTFFIFLLRLHDSCSCVGCLTCAIKCVA